MTPKEVKLITELLPEAFILLSRSGAILGANPAAQELFRTEHLVGLALADLVTDPASTVSEWLNDRRASRRMTAKSFNLHTEARPFQFASRPAFFKPETQTILP